MTFEELLNLIYDCDDSEVTFFVSTTDLPNGVSDFTLQVTKASPVIAERIVGKSFVVDEKSCVTSLDLKEFDNEGN